MCVLCGVAQGSRGSSKDSDKDDLPDVFDAPEAEPTEGFVNPFACSVNPLDWREVQVRQTLAIAVRRTYQIPA